MVFFQESHLESSVLTSRKVTHISQEKGTRKIKSHVLRSEGGDTVDGSAILLSPLEVGSSSHYFTGLFLHPKWCRSFLLPDVVVDGRAV